MNRYTKVINMMESYFTKDFEKAKKGITKTREVKEETGLDVKYPKICGIKWWEVSKNKRYVVLLFKTNEYCGALQSSDEGKVFWAKLDELESMKLAENFDKILNVFTDDDVQERIQLKNHGQWIDILK